MTLDKLLIALQPYEPSVHFRDDYYENSKLVWVLRLRAPFTQEFQSDDLQHLITLGEAYLTSSKDRFKSQLNDYTEELDQ